MTLLLFDIDGTLVQLNDTGRDLIRETLTALSSAPISTEDVSFSGRTDPDIFEAVLEANDLPVTTDAIDRAINLYVDQMTSHLSESDVTLLPGVPALLSKLNERPDVHLGLVTGNVKPVAYQKLRVHDLDKYFGYGAFGSDHADRNELPTLAVQRAAERTEHTFRPDEHVTVIGDTVHDVACARAVGARAVAVCTGNYGRNRLASSSPDVVVDRLKTTEDFIQQVLTV